MKYRKFSIKFKLKCLEIVKYLGIYKTSKFTKIDKKCIKQWNLNKEIFLKMENKNSSYRLPGYGLKRKYPVQEKEIINFIFKCKEIGIPLNTNIIIEELYRICPTIKNNSKNSLRKWCYRLFKKYQLKIKDIATV